jgi:hypothetical protein
VSDVKIASEKSVETRVRVFAPNNARSFTGVHAGDLVDELRAQNFTGKLTMDMSQGGVCVVQTEERLNKCHLTDANNST